MIARLFLLVADGGEAALASGRYEFRCWPDRPPFAVGALQRSWRLAACERRCDISFPYAVQRLAAG